MVFASGSLAAFGALAAALAVGFEEGFAEGVALLASGFFAAGFVLEALAG